MQIERENEKWMNGTLWKYMYIFDGIYDITMHIKVMYFIIRVIPTWIGNIKIIYSLLARASGSNNCHTSMLDSDVCSRTTTYQQHHLSGDWLNCWRNPSEHTKMKQQKKTEHTEESEIHTRTTTEMRTTFTAAVATAEKTEMLVHYCVNWRFELGFFLS